MPEQEDNGIVLDPATFGRFDRAASRLEKEPEVPLRQEPRRPRLGQRAPQAVCLIGDLVPHKTAKAHRLEWSDEDEEWQDSGSEETVFFAGPSVDHRIPAGATLFAWPVPQRAALGIFDRVEWGFTNSVSSNALLEGAVFAVGGGSTGGAVPFQLIASNPLENDFLVLGKHLPGRVASTKDVVPIRTRPPFWALYDPQDGTPQSGELWGPVENETRLRKEPTVDRTIPFQHNITVTVTDAGTSGSCDCDVEVEIDDVTETVRYGWKVADVDTDAELVLVSHASLLQETVTDVVSP